VVVLVALAFGILIILLIRSISLNQFFAKYILKLIILKSITTIVNIYYILNIVKQAGVVIILSI